MLSLSSAVQRPGLESDEVQWMSPCDGSPVISHSLLSRAQFRVLVLASVLYTHYKGWIIITMLSVAADVWLNTSTGMVTTDHIIFSVCRGQST